jgi:hypothetical protein
MSDPLAIIVPMMKECPRSEGNFDCTPFCDVCEGNQEYAYTEYRKCIACPTPVDHDTWFEELGFCIDCSNAYFNQELDPFTLERIK